MIDSGIDTMAYAGFPDALLGPPFSKQLWFTAPLDTAVICKTIDLISQRIYLSRSFPVSHNHMISRAHDSLKLSLPFW